MTRSYNDTHRDTTISIDPLSAYDYTVPSALIAQAPAHPRDSARLLVFDRKTRRTTFDTFRGIATYLPSNAVLVLNETRVIPARMHLWKKTGGSISCLFLRDETPQRGVSTIRVLAGGKLKQGDLLAWNDGHSFTVEKREGKEALLRPSFPIEALHDLLEAYGETPLPPYIKHSPLSEEERRAEYQTVFARKEGSVAAPTAGLHFTEELLDRIRAHGCDVRTVTLHVNLGTFAPVTEEQIRNRTLHTEHYRIDRATAAFLNEAKSSGRPIIAVGTTVVRTLESAMCHPEVPARVLRGSAFVRSCLAPQHDTRWPRMGDTPRLTHLSGSTSLFLSPENPPRFVDGLITNFHVPRSSLLMLVAAYTGREKLLELYRQAMERRFRFFSFGDGMMIL